MQCKCSKLYYHLCVAYFRRFDSGNSVRHSELLYSCQIGMKSTFNIVGEFTQSPQISSLIWQPHHGSNRGLLGRCSICSEWAVPTPEGGGGGTLAGLAEPRLDPPSVAPISHALQKYTMNEGHGHDVVRALETHSKVVQRKLEVEFCVVVAFQSVE